MSVTGRTRARPAINPPISGPASSWRKCEAPAITWSISPPSAAANRRPVSSGSTGSESAHRNSFGRGIRAQGVEHALARLAARHLRRDRQDQRERARSRLGGGVRERRVVAGDHRVAGVVQARPPDEQPDRQILGPLDEPTERHPRFGHLLMPGEQPGVEYDDPRNAVRPLDRHAQPDRAAPVVDDDGGVVEVELVHERRDARRVGVVRVPVDVERLVERPNPGRSGAMQR